MSEEVKEVKVVRKKKNYKFRRFWKIYAIVIAVLIVGVVIININAWDTMVTYEAAQPEHVLDEALKDIAAGKVDVQIEGNPFEDTTEIAKAKFLESVSGKELSYMLDSKSYDVENPIYDVLVNDQTVCKVTLSAKNKRPLMAILSIYDWEVSNLEPVISLDAQQSVKVTVPENFMVTVNDITLGADYASGEAKAVAAFDKIEEYVAQYVAVPKYVTYEVKGLYNAPTVQVFDAAGMAVDLGENPDLSNLSVEYKTTEVPAEIYTMALNNAKTFSNYFSCDIPDCYSSINGIRYMFPADSSYLVDAERYRNEDMWMYSKHFEPWFENEIVQNYIVYSENLFSVEVGFSKNMMLIYPNGVAMNEQRTDNVYQIFQYGKVDGNWVILDMRSIIK